ncbi:hypothetical protein H0H81_011443 [Sphagnurus paluster]|uniref:Uncharacterized protein n=1 Tax=Sphagnurus paluster TaxID=117069 RepID=A0A9P7GP97_9AGAR|nr:hypothetical protein H0H81_011443 [Sphagnurus paluster]
MLKPLFYLPLVPLLATAHLTVGHAILHHANPHSPSWAPHLLSTAFAGAIGGTILGVPLIVLWVHILSIRAQRLARNLEIEQQEQQQEPEDGSGSSNSLTRRMKWVGYLAIILSGAPAAGALGVVCLHETGMRNREKLLSPGDAVVAGVVGGSVVWGCVFGFLAFAFGVFAGCMNIRAYRIRKENARYLAQKRSESSRSTPNLP